MPMGKGAWVNKETGDYKFVSEHEKFLYYNPDEARELGVPKRVLDKIQEMDIKTDGMDMKILAIKEGRLIRVRAKSFAEISAEFWATTGIENILWTIDSAIDRIYGDKVTEITVANLAKRDYAQMSVKEFRRKLKDGKPILRESRKMRKRLRKKISRKINESGLSRTRQHMLNHDTGMITANRYQIVDETGDVVSVTRSQNKMRNSQLLSELRSQYGVTSMRGSFIENYGTRNAVEVGENTFFVVDLDDTGRLEDDLRHLGEKWDQDSILFVPQGGESGILWGTNPRPVDEDVDPPYGRRNVLGKPVFGKAGQFMTKVGGRPFVFESVEIEHGKRSRRGFFNELGRHLYQKRDWRDF